VAHIRLTLDGDTLMDGDLGAWQQQPPEAVADMLRNGGRGEPWHRPTLMVIADADLRNKSATITITTSADGWTLDVQDC
jgi:hypothetical protein